MEDIKNLLNSGISASIALLCVYPLEIVKIRLQSSKKLIMPIQTYYRGLMPSLGSVFVEKGVKISTYDFLINNNIPLIPSVIGTTLFHTLITTPVENYRILKQINKKISMVDIRHNLYYGHKFTILRDIIFNMTLFGINELSKKQHEKYKQFYYNICGGMMASMIATPIDYVKTRYQSGEKLPTIYHNIKNNPLLTIKGLTPRMISIGIVYGLTFWLYNNYKFIR